MGLSGAFLLLSQWSTLDSLSWKESISKDLTQLKPSGFENLSLYITLSPYIAQREKDSSYCLLACLFVSQASLLRKTFVNA